MLHERLAPHRLDPALHPHLRLSGLIYPLFLVGKVVLGDARLGGERNCSGRQRAGGRAG